MAQWINQDSQIGNSKRLSFFADTESDISNLPTDPDEVAIGSDCTVIASGNVYILNSTYTWVAFGG